MNISEFAEQIVFGHRLEEKLARPGRLTADEGRRRLRVDDLPTPGRPIGMEMHAGPGAAQLPTARELEGETARGRLLHFLANHELLATELMALVLLKFPDAPTAFRRGVLVTLQEEQEHTRMYLNRMKECGVEFGSFPLSGHFWRVVEPMQSPMDFVSRLSLTFEQANLDYSLHFASLFQQIGDTKTAKILRKIYEDEIGHVQHGLDWFRKWKDPSQSDWEAYSENLEFPMSPQRARGPKCAFNRAGRKQAGLTDDYIDAIEVFRQSRGRPPTVRWFDPGAEASLARELSRKELTLLNQLGRDLGSLMVWLTKQDDIVLVQDDPSKVFRRHLMDIGAELPEFVRWDDVASLAERKLDSLEPWAWTPTSVELAKPLKDVTRSVPHWREDQRELFRKSWASDRLRDWLREPVGYDWLPSADCAGRVVTDESGVRSALEALRAHGTAAIFKQDLATSGRGQRRFESGKPLDAQDASWIKSAFAACDEAIVEPELDRILDLSFLWTMPAEPTGPAEAGESPEPNDSADAEFLGWTRQRISDGRRFEGTCLRRPFADCSAELKRFLLSDDCSRLHQVREWIEKRLLPELRARHFTGRLGVDVFVFRTSSGELRIKPLVELNPRTTMGHVAQMLERRLAPTVRGEFRILRGSEWQRLQPFLNDLQLARSSDGRWKSGVVCLSEPTQQSKFVPIVVVGEANMAQLDEWVCS